MPSCRTTATLWIALSQVLKHVLKRPVYSRATSIQPHLSLLPLMAAALGVSRQRMLEVTKQRLDACGAQACDVEGACELLQQDASSNTIRATDSTAWVQQ